MVDRYTVTIDKWGGVYRRLKGDLHCTTGPAITHIDIEAPTSYWLHGKLHRTDGPAVIYSNGKVAYAINGVYFSEYDFKEGVSLDKD